MLSIFSQERVTKQYGDQRMAEGEVKGRLEAVLSLLKKGIITEEQAASGAGLTVDAFRKAVTALA